VSAIWFGVIGTSAAAYALKILGYSVPQKLLSRPRVQRTNALIPIVLLSALVAVQTFAVKSKLEIDHRALGLVVTAVALKFHAPFPVVVILAGLSSALVYHFH
jgi:branched-subunit amino acid transport protein